MFLKIQSQAQNFVAPRLPFFPPTPNFLMHKMQVRNQKPKKKKTLFDSHVILAGQAMNTKVSLSQ